MDSTIADANRGPELVAVTWAFTALAILIVGLKIFTRARILKEMALDDFFTTFSLVLVIACTSLISASANAGMGRHAERLTFSQGVKATKLNFIANPFGIMAYSLPNVSVAIFIQRILRLSRLRKWLLYFVPITQNVIAGVSCILLFAQCSPTEFLWNPTIKAKCLSTDVITGYSYFVGAFSAFTDVFLAVVPITAFWKLQMKLRSKLGISLLMGTTALAAICAIVKTSKLNELADLKDFTYGTVDLLIWAVIEADVIIIAACIPSLRPFAVAFTHTVQNLSGRSRPKRNFYQGYRSDAPLALIPTRPKEVGNSTDIPRGDSVSENSFKNARKIKQTTDISLDWE